MVVAKLCEGTVRSSGAVRDVQGSTAEDGKEQEGRREVIHEGGSSEDTGFNYQKLN